VRKREGSGEEGMGSEDKEAIEQMLDLEESCKIHKY
jgi:hypothetical protein